MGNVSKDHRSHDYFDKLYLKRKKSFFSIEKVEEYIRLDKRNSFSSKTKYLLEKIK